MIQSFILLSFFNPWKPISRAMDWSFEQKYGGMILPELGG